MPLSKCCCCIPVKEGVISIGILSLVGSLAELIHEGVAFKPNEDALEAYKELLKDYKYLDVDTVTNVSRAAMICSMVFFAIHFPSSVALIIGANTGRKYLLLPYMVMSVLGLLLGIIISIVITVTIGSPGAIFWSVLGFACALTGYFLHVIGSLYRIISQEEQLPPSTMVPSSKIFVTSS